jgi:hypothetical protein
VPLNLRFDIRQSPTSRWFVGAGVSSYNLLNEKYEFNYNSYDPSTVMYDYDTKSKSNWAILCHANASVGYERRLTNRLSILAEPYVRIPAEVGRRSGESVHGRRLVFGALHAGFQEIKTK